MFITETDTYPEGIYQIEPTDPVMGGAEGIANRQAKDLAARTKYLKKYADEVEEAKGAFPTLKEKLEQYDEFTPESQQIMSALMLLNTYSAGQANQRVSRLEDINHQRGELIITNRGIISGCAVTKSTTATRNLSLAVGQCFAGARLIPAPASENIAVIPSNLTGEDGYCWCYLLEVNQKMQMFCTEVGKDLPEGVIPLYKINIPAGNTSETDPQGNAVTLTDVRRKEPGYPSYYITPPGETIAFDYPLTDINYMVNLEVSDVSGGMYQIGTVNVVDKAKNGFSLIMDGMADQVLVKWEISRRDIK